MRVEGGERNPGRGKGFVMLTPDDFEVNEAWIAVRVNDSYMLVQGEPYDVYVLMDAASTFVFGHALSKAEDGAPPRRDVEALFKTAWKAKRQWPEKLVVPEDDPAESVFRMQAEKNELVFETVPLSELAPIVGPLKESFVSSFAR